MGLWETVLPDEALRHLRSWPRSGARGRRCVPSGNGGRWRLHLVRHRTALKNRIHPTLLAFGHPGPVSDLFETGGRAHVEPGGPEVVAAESVQFGIEPGRVDKGNPFDAEAT